MPFQAFFHLFPEIAFAETRSVTLLEPQYGLPAGEYAFAEQFCNDPGCDCRRVIFGVLQKGRRDPIAHIGWGWEPREFYAKWMHWDNDPLMIDQCKGPAFEGGVIRNG